MLQGGTLPGQRRVPVTSLLQCLFTFNCLISNPASVTYQQCKQDLVNFLLCPQFPRAGGWNDHLVMSVSYCEAKKSPVR